MLRSELELLKQRQYCSTFKLGRKRLIQSHLHFRNVQIKCLQNIEDLQMTCKELGLKFVDCSKQKTNFKVDLILDHKRSLNQKYYLVKWKGLDLKKSSWQSEENLHNCEDMIYYYESLERPPSHITRRMMYYFIMNLISGQPRDSITLIKLCTLIYGLSEVYLNDLKLTSEELNNKVLNILNISLTRLGRIKDKLINLMRFSESRKLVLLNLKEWEIKINAGSTLPYIEVENNVDLETAPTGFEFINDYVSYSVNFPTAPVVFCSCTNCDKNSGCCAEHFDSHFAYNRNGQIMLLPGYAVYECNRLCNCDKNCSNRVVQHGQKIKLAIFRTSNGCGWGLKTLETIQKDKFVLEYLGEIITSKAAQFRGEVYDYIGKTYLFDLDFNENALYTVDGGIVGNSSHFINHSCNPNLYVFTVWIDQHDPNLPRLAFFTKRKIYCGEELTFDYKMVDSREKSGIPIPEHERMLCKCNSKNCKKYLY